MKNNSIRRLPVVSNQKIIGIAHKENILNSLYLGIKQINNDLYKVMENIHEAVCIINKDKIVVCWNDKAEKLYGIDKEQILYKSVEEFFDHPLIVEVLNKEQSIGNVHHAPRKGNHVAISAVPLYNNGKLIGAVSTERDITEITSLTLKLKETKQRLKNCKNYENQVKENQNINKIKKGDVFADVLGESKVITKKINKAKIVAQNNCNILITGESGTGKELFAQAIHQASTREGKFIPVNCSAIPKNLFESEMFGYVKGAFTGASDKGKKGNVELANNGTLFLDEIGDMPLPMQAKLLRVLQEGRIKKVGGEDYIDVNVRIICATNKNLRNLMNRGEFREDLFYRINVIKLELPSLAERKEDIPVLLEYFLNQLCEKNNISVPELDSKVLAALMEYEWEGNIRELKNVVKHLVAFSVDGRIVLDSLPERILDNLPSDLIDNQSNSNEQFEEEVFDLDKVVRETEIQKIKKAMKLTDGNKKKAAELLNIPRSTLYYKIKQYDLKHLI
ncbi:sigma 54-interacting transcriptional regulator [Sporohalobacter salinus]|uniref:sigma 54-interacting transcriptional regulator n=1 Tax=Sporohalobacter salinus TaxID=1494606 RepID=UPI00195FCFA2|nr:sigma 54-interacting transcriptional regulator [Sporohalobacter salinus]MBM7622530.1 PAS domain S-box-containing protein [Sporohalobacter salinus]